MVSYANFKTTDAQYCQVITDRVNVQRNFINAKAVIAKLIDKHISSILYISKDTEFGNPVPDDILLKSIISILRRKNLNTKQHNRWSALSVVIFL